MTRPFVLAETTWKTVQSTPFAAAILPWGATEAHNYHLPYGTDNVLTEHVAVRAVEQAWNRDESGDHAGEAETAAMLHLAPALVRPLNEAGAGKARAWRLTGIREGWAWAPRRWTQVTSDTGIGNPARATAEKGEAYVSAAVEQ